MLARLVQGGALVAVVTVALGATGAWAAPQVSIPAPYPQNGQVITVTGSGFPVEKTDPTGLAILECSDPGGTVTNLPETPQSCDGATVNPLQINTDANGNFSARYTVAALNPRDSDITCDQTHFCVLWVGIDYNNRFLGIHAFSTPFKVGASGSAPSSGSGTSAVFVLPIVGILVLGGGFLLGRGRRQHKGGGTPTPPRERASSIS